MSKGPLAVRWGAPPRAALQAGTTAIVARRGDERRLAAVERPGLPRLALARRPRQPDRLGRAAQRGCPPLAPGESAAVEARSACRSRPAATGSPSTWSPSCAPGSRSSAARCSPTTSRSARATASRTRDAARSVEPAPGLGGARARRARRGLRRRRRRDRLAGRLAAPAAARAGAVRARPRPRAGLLVAAPLPVGRCPGSSSSRSARSQACRRSPRRRASRGSTTAGSCCGAEPSLGLQLDRDAVVDAAEDERAEQQRQPAATVR